MTSLTHLPDAHHRFVAEECDWGFTRFADLRKLYTADSANGKTRATIENEEVEITAFVRVLKDPTGVLWHNFVNYDSKKETGHVGLRNQGATCYMNSLLQSLYCTNYFRKVGRALRTSTHPRPCTKYPQTTIYPLKALRLRSSVSSTTSRPRTSPSAQPS